MYYKKFSGAASAALMIVTSVILVSACGASAQSKFKVLYSFPNYTGGSPLAGLIFDQAGNLYSTAYEDVGHNGSVFTLAPNADGSWTERMLYSFTGGVDGGAPRASVIFDQSGNLYGTAGNGGDLSCDAPFGCGVVFKLTPNAGGSWTETVLYSFTGGADGGFPFASVIFDQSGNLYGTTSGGGAHGAGTVFELTPNTDGTWTEHVLRQFTGGKGGGGPQAGLIFDQAGNLYGTTSGGGTYEAGVVFKLAPNANGSWTASVLHQFTGGEDGGGPLDGLIFDKAGNLYGTASGGGAGGDGVVFKLTPRSGGKWWGEKVLHAFTGGDDGAVPAAGLIFDSAGNLYGTTQNGGGSGYGTVFKLAPASGGRPWRERILHAFRGPWAAWPVAGLVLDPAGNLYSTTQAADDKHAGEVFEITP